ncbi:hypothetical protein SD71_10540 [Cohnella kolymensis]|uniref:NfeD-like C-terminal domain-containing protein n=1 Tax=Cohnella kolymensis TaxID=1590652 RepID=A0ABR5A5W0_9BACL|nr:NfeD family protein [Cohnella kolymensis]KIL35832.1 hypothetical protein SD71_10540 [Cohnella kolymensis]
MEWWAIWLIVGGVLFIAEMLTFTFYLLWLGIGAIVAAAVALAAPETFVWQALAGGAAALILTVFTKPLTRRIREARGYSDAIDELVGKPGIVIEDIIDGKAGIVRVGSETWSAVSQQQLLKNEKVMVIRRGTTVLEVQRWGGSF